MEKVFPNLRSVFTMLPPTDRMSVCGYIVGTMVPLYFYMFRIPLGYIKVYHSFTLFTNVDILINMTDFIYKMDRIEEGRIRFIISLNEEEMGSLYFEKAKKGFNRKPVSMDAWVCVDSKIERLYEVSNYDITPKEIVEVCQKMIRSEYL